MAKKKSTNRTDKGAGQPSPPDLPNPMELAAPISARVTIQGIMLVESNLRRTPDTLGTRSKLRVNIKVANVSYRIETESGKLIVLPTFELSAEREIDSEDPPFLSIRASFALEYTVESINDFGDENIRAFAETNGIFNAWPYWREYVQSTSARMGFPVMTIPVFRVS
jgi:hypothetical protein